MYTEKRKMAATQLMWPCATLTIYLKYVKIMVTVKQPIVLLSNELYCPSIKSVMSKYHLPVRITTSSKELSASVTV